MLFFFLSLSTVCSRVVTINRGAKENKLEYCEIFPVVQYMLWCANKNFKVKGVYSLFCDNHPSPHPPKKILPLPWLMHVDPVAKTDNYCHSHFCPGLPCPGKLPRPPQPKITATWGPFTATTLLKNLHPLPRHHAHCWGYL